MIKSKSNLSIYFGLFLAVVLICSGFFLKTNPNFSKTFLYIFDLVIYIIILTTGIYFFKKKNNGFLSLKEALKVGLLISLVSGILMLLWDLIIIHLFEFDSYRPTGTKKIKPKNSTQEILFFAMVAFLSNLFLAFLTSLLAGAIMQKNKDIYE